MRQCKQIAIGSFLQMQTLNFCNWEQKETIVCFTSVSEAFHYCFAAYFIINISYPADFRVLMMMLETYMYKLKLSGKEPLIVRIALNGYAMMMNNDSCVVFCFRNFSASHVTVVYVANF